MLCPNPECESRQTGEQLPDDYTGTYCDMCNCALYKCVNPECEAYGVLTTNAKFCTSCSESVESNGTASPVQNHVRTEMKQAGAGSKIFLRHSEGWTLEITDGDILGRVSGNHSGRLGVSRVVSGTHAKITRDQDGWYITDQKSLNKTVINGQTAEPYTPVRIKKNDVVTLADMKFLVVEI